MSSHQITVDILGNLRVNDLNGMASKIDEWSRGINIPVNGVGANGKSMPISSVIGEELVKTAKLLKSGKGSASKLGAMFATLFATAAKKGLISQEMLAGFGDKTAVGAVAKQLFATALGTELERLLALSKTVAETKSPRYSKTEAGERVQAYGYAAGKNPKVVPTLTDLLVMSAANGNVSSMAELFSKMRSMPTLDKTLTNTVGKIDEIDKAFEAATKQAEELRKKEKVLREERLKGAAATDKQVKAEKADTAARQKNADTTEKVVKENTGTTGTAKGSTKASAVEEVVVAGTSGKGKSTGSTGSAGKSTTTVVMGTEEKSVREGNIKTMSEWLRSGLLYREIKAVPNGASNKFLEKLISSYNKANNTAIRSDILSEGTKTKLADFFDSRRSAIAISEEAMNNIWGALENSVYKIKAPKDTSRTSKLKRVGGNYEGERTHEFLEYNLNTGRLGTHALEESGLSRALANMQARGMKVDSSSMMWLKADTIDRRARERLSEYVRNGIFQNGELYTMAAMPANEMRSGMVPFIRNDLAPALKELTWGGLSVNQLNAARKSAEGGEYAYSTAKAGNNLATNITGSTPIDMRTEFLTTKWNGKGWEKTTTNLLDSIAVLPAKEAGIITATWSKEINAAERRITDSTELGKLRKAKEAFKQSMTDGMGIMSLEYANAIGRNIQGINKDAQAYAVGQFRGEGVKANVLMFDYKGYFRELIDKGYMNYEAFNAKTEGGGMLNFLDPNVQMILTPESIKNWKAYKGETYAEKLANWKAAMRGTGTGAQDKLALGNTQWGVVNTEASRALQREWSAQMIQNRGSFTPEEIQFLTQAHGETFLKALTSPRGYMEFLGINQQSPLGTMLKNNPEFMYTPMAMRMLAKRAFTDNASVGFFDRGKAGKLLTNSANAGSTWNFMLPDPVGMFSAWTGRNLGEATFDADGKLISRSAGAIQGARYGSFDIDNKSTYEQVPVTQPVYAPGALAAGVTVGSLMGANRFPNNAASNVIAGRAPLLERWGIGENGAIGLRQRIGKKGYGGSNNVVYMSSGNPMITQLNADFDGDAMELVFGKKGAQHPLAKELNTIMGEIMKPVINKPAGGAITQENAAMFVPESLANKTAIGASSNLITRWMANFPLAEGIAGGVNLPSNLHNEAGLLGLVTNYYSSIDKNKAGYAYDLMQRFMAEAQSGKYPNFQQFIDQVKGRGYRGSQLALPGESGVMLGVDLIALAMENMKQNAIKSMNESMNLRNPEQLINYNKNKYQPFNVKGQDVFASGAFTKESGIKLDLEGKSEAARAKEYLRGIDEIRNQYLKTGKGKMAAASPYLEAVQKVSKTLAGDKKSFRNIGSALMGGEMSGYTGQLALVPEAIMSKYAETMTASPLDVLKASQGFYKSTATELNRLRTLSNKAYGYTSNTDEAKLADVFNRMNSIVQTLPKLGLSQEQISQSILGGTSKLPGMKSEFTPDGRDWDFVRRVLKASALTGRTMGYKYDTNRVTGFRINKNLAKGEWQTIPELTEQARLGELMTGMSQGNVRQANGFGSFSIFKPNQEETGGGRGLTTAGKAKILSGLKTVDDLLAMKDTGAYRRSGEPTYGKPNETVDRLVKATWTDRMNNQMEMIAKLERTTGSSRVAIEKPISEMSENVMYTHPEAFKELMGAVNKQALIDMYNSAVAENPNISEKELWNRYNKLKATRAMQNKRYNESAISGNYIADLYTAEEGTPAAYATLMKNFAKYSALGAQEYTHTGLIKAGRPAELKLIMENMEYALHEAFGGTATYTDASGKKVEKNFKKGTNKAYKSAKAVMDNYLAAAEQARASGDLVGANLNTMLAEAMRGTVAQLQSKMLTVDLGRARWAEYKKALKEYTELTAPGSESNKQILGVSRKAYQALGPIEKLKAMAANKTGLRLWKMAYGNEAIRYGEAGTTDTSTFGFGLMSPLEIMSTKNAGKLANVNNYMAAMDEAIRYGDLFNADTEAFMKNLIATKGASQKDFLKPYEKPAYPAPTAKEGSMDLIGELSAAGKTKAGMEALRASKGGIYKMFEGADVYTPVVVDGKELSREESYKAREANLKNLRGQEAKAQQRLNEETASFQGLLPAVQQRIDNIRATTKGIPKNGSMEEAEINGLFSDISKRRTSIEERQRELATILESIKSEERQQELAREIKKNGGGIGAAGLKVETTAGKAITLEQHENTKAELRTNLDYLKSQSAISGTNYLQTSNAIDTLQPGESIMWSSQQQAVLDRRKELENLEKKLQRQEEVRKSNETKRLRKEATEAATRRANEQRALLDRTTRQRLADANRQINEDFGRKIIRNQIEQGIRRDIQSGKLAPMSSDAIKVKSFVDAATRERLYGLSENIPQSAFATRDSTYRVPRNLQGTKTNAQSILERFLNDDMSALLGRGIQETGMPGIINRLRNYNWQGLSERIQNYSMPGMISRGAEPLLTSLGLTGQDIRSGAGGILTSIAQRPTLGKALRTNRGLEILSRITGKPLGRTTTETTAPTVMAPGGKQGGELTDPLSIMTDAAARATIPTTPTTESAIANDPMYRLEQEEKQLKEQRKAERKARRKQIKAEARAERERIAAEEKAAKEAAAKIVSPEDQARITDRNLAVAAAEEKASMATSNYFEEMFGKTASTNNGEYEYKRFSTAGEGKEVLGPSRETMLKALQAAEKNAPVLGPTRKTMEDALRKEAKARSDAASAAAKERYKQQRSEERRANKDYTKSGHYAEYEKAIQEARDAALNPNRYASEDEQAKAIATALEKARRLALSILESPAGRAAGLLDKGTLLGAERRLILPKGIATTEAERMVYSDTAKLLQEFRSNYNIKTRDTATDRVKNAINSIKGMSKIAAAELKQGMDIGYNDRLLREYAKASSSADKLIEESVKGKRAQIDEQDRKITNSVGDRRIALVRLKQLMELDEELSAANKLRDTKTAISETLKALRTTTDAKEKANLLNTLKELEGSLVSQRDKIASRYLEEAMRKGTLAQRQMGYTQGLIDLQGASEKTGGRYATATGQRNLTFSELMERASAIKTGLAEERIAKLDTRIAKAQESIDASRRTIDNNTRIQTEATKIALQSTGNGQVKGFTDKQSSAIGAAQLGITKAQRNIERQQKIIELATGERLAVTGLYSKADENGMLRASLGEKIAYAATSKLTEASNRAAIRRQYGSAAMQLMFEDLAKQGGVFGQTYNSLKNGLTMWRNNATGLIVPTAYGAQAPIGKPGESFTQVGSKAGQSWQRAALGAGATYFNAMSSQNMNKMWGAQMIYSHGVEYLTKFYDATKELNDQMREYQKIQPNWDTSSMSDYVSELGSLGRTYGKTTAEMAEASLILTRGGYGGISQSEKGRTKPSEKQLELNRGMTEASILMSNIADEEMDVEDSSSAIISAVKAWNTTDEEATTFAQHYVDAANEVSNNFAVSSNDITTNLATVASASATNGMDINETIALLATGAEISQNAGKTATAMKTIIGRFNTINDRETSTTGQWLYDFFQTNGIEITDENDQLDFYKMVQNMGEYWDKMSQDLQSLFAQKIAGSRQASNWANWMLNIGDLEAIRTTAEDSYGSAAKSNEAKMNSIEGAQSRLAANTLTFYQSAISSDAIVMGINALSTALGALNKIPFASTAAGIATISLALGGIVGYIPTMVKFLGGGALGGLLGMGKSVVGAASGIHTVATKGLGATGLGKGLANFRTGFTSGVVAPTTATMSIAKGGLEATRLSGELLALYRKNMGAVQNPYTGKWMMYAGSMGEQELTHQSWDKMSDYQRKQWIAAREGMKYDLTARNGKGNVVYKNNAYGIYDEAGKITKKGTLTSTIKTPTISKAATLGRGASGALAGIGGILSSPLFLGAMLVGAGAIGGLKWAASNRDKKNLITVENFDKLLDTQEKATSLQETYQKEMRDAYNATIGSDLEKQGLTKGTEEYNKAYANKAWDANTALSEYEAMEGKISSEYDDSLRSYKLIQALIVYQQRLIEDQVGGAVNASTSASGIKGMITDTLWGLGNTNSFIETAGEINSNYQQYLKAALSAERYNNQLAYADVANVSHDSALYLSVLEAQQNATAYSTSMRDAYQSKLTDVSEQYFNTMERLKKAAPTLGYEKSIKGALEYAEELESQGKIAAGTAEALKSVTSAMDITTESSYLTAAAMAEVEVETEYEANDTKSFITQLGSDYDAVEEAMESLTNLRGKGWDSWTGEDLSKISKAFSFATDENLEDYFENFYGEGKTTSDQDRAWRVLTQLNLENMYGVEGLAGFEGREQYLAKYYEDRNFSAAEAKSAAETIVADAKAELAQLTADLQLSLGKEQYDTIQTLDMIEALGNGDLAAAVQALEYDNTNLEDAEGKKGTRTSTRATNKYGEEYDKYSDSVAKFSEDLNAAGLGMADVAAIAKEWYEQGNVLYDENGLELTQGQALDYMMDNYSPAFDANTSATDANTAAINGLTALMVIQNGGNPADYGFAENEHGVYLDEDLLEAGGYVKSEETNPETKNPIWVNPDDTDFIKTADGKYFRNGVSAEGHNYEADPGGTGYYPKGQEGVSWFRDDEGHFQNISGFIPGRENGYKASPQWVVDNPDALGAERSGHYEWLYTPDKIEAMPGYNVDKANTPDQWTLHVSYNPETGEKEVSYTSTGTTAADAMWGRGSENQGTNKPSSQGKSGGVGSAQTTSSEGGTITTWGNDEAERTGGAATAKDIWNMAMRSYANEETERSGAPTTTSAATTTETAEVKEESTGILDKIFDAIFPSANAGLAGDVEPWGEAQADTGESTTRDLSELKTLLDDSSSKLTDAFALGYDTSDKLGTSSDKLQTSFDTGEKAGDKVQLASDTLKNSTSNLKDTEVEVKTDVDESGIDDKLTSGKVEYTAEVEDVNTKDELKGGTVKYESKVEKPKAEKVEGGTVTYKALLDTSSLKGGMKANSVKVNADTAGALSSINAVSSAANAIPANKSVSVTATDNASATLGNIVSKLNSIHSKSVTITTNYVLNGSSSGGSKEGGVIGVNAPKPINVGERHADGGAISGNGMVGTWLGDEYMGSGEKKPELVVTPDGNAHIAGLSGWEYESLPKGTRVYSNAETKKMLGGNYDIGNLGHRHAEGGNVKEGEDRKINGRVYSKDNYSKALEKKDKQGERHANGGFVGIRRDRGYREGYVGDELTASPVTTTSGTTTTDGKKNSTGSGGNTGSTNTNNKSSSSTGDSTKAAAANVEGYVKDIKDSIKTLVEQYDTMVKVYSDQVDLQEKKDEKTDVVSQERFDLQQKEYDTLVKYKDALEKAGATVENSEDLREVLSKMEENEQEKIEWEQENYQHQIDVLDYQNKTIENENYALNNEEKYSEQILDNLEKELTVLEQKRLNLLENGYDEFSDEVREASEDAMDKQQEIVDMWSDAIDRFVEATEKLVERDEDYQDYISWLADERKEELQEEEDYKQQQYDDETEIIEKQDKEIERQQKLTDAEADLMDAQKKRVMVMTETGWEWKSDTKSVRDAQKNYDDVKRSIENEIRDEEREEELKDWKESLWENYYGKGSQGKEAYATDDSIYKLLKSMEDAEDVREHDQLKWSTELQYGVQDLEGYLNTINTSTEQYRLDRDNADNVIAQYLDDLGLSAKDLIEYNQDGTLNTLKLILNIDRVLPFNEMTDAQLKTYLEMMNAVKQNETTFDLEEGRQEQQVENFNAIHNALSTQYETINLIKENIANSDGTKITLLEKLYGNTETFINLFGNTADGLREEAKATRENANANTEAITTTTTQTSANQVASTDNTTNAITTAASDTNAKIGEASKYTVGEINGNSKDYYDSSTTNLTSIDYNTSATAKNTATLVTGTLSANGNINSSTNTTSENSKASYLRGDYVLLNGSSGTVNALNVDASGTYKEYYDNLRNLGVNIGNNPTLYNQKIKTLYEAANELQSRAAYQEANTLDANNVYSPTITVNTSVENTNASAEDIAHASAKAILQALTGIGTNASLTAAQRGTAYAKATSRSYSGGSSYSSSSNSSSSNSSSKTSSSKTGGKTTHL